MNAQDWIELVTPAAPVPDAPQAGQQRARTQQGLRIGLLDNSKANADHLLQRLLEQLQADLPVTSTLTLRKLNPSRGAPVDTLDRLAAEADLVFTAMGD